MKTSPSQTANNQISKLCKAIVAPALALILTGNIAAAQSSYPPASLLAAQWWQWALETPISESPLLDTTGQFAAVNQPAGQVWFLAGNEGGTTVRTVTIPAGKALFFPIANTVDVEQGAAKGGGGIVFSAKQPLQVAQAFVSNAISTANGLSCSVDGTALPITAANLEQSAPFALQLPADNLFGVPPGVYFPAVDSGYYVLLKPLASGQHMIHFTGGIASFGFSLDVTYYITIQ